MPTTLPANAMVYILQKDAGFFHLAVQQGYLVMFIWIFILIVACHYALKNMKK